MVNSGWSPAFFIGCLGVGGRKPSFSVSFLGVREAAGGKSDPQMTLKGGFAGRWGGAGQTGPGFLFKFDLVRFEPCGYVVTVFWGAAALLA